MVECDTGGGQSHTVDHEGESRAEREFKVDKPLGLITWHKVSFREEDDMEGVNSNKSSIGTDEVASSCNGRQC